MLLLRAAVAALLLLLSSSILAHARAIPLGAARIDVTPEGPIRLSGYGARRTESEGVTTRLYARALAIGADADAPVVLVAIDACVLDFALTDALAQRLQAHTQIDRAHLVVTATHAHTAPMLAGTLPNLFAADIPEDQQRHIRDYTAFVLDRLEQVALAALAARTPCLLERSRGEVAFAQNRRTRGGPTDHDLPVLRARRGDGTLVALVADYACHCTTLGPELNRTCGDWAGFAATALEAAHPGCVALVTIGCGADQDPEPRTGLELAQRHGKALAAEVERLQPLPWLPVRGPVVARYQVLDLPLQPLPTAEQWQQRSRQPGIVGYHAAVQLARLQRGEPLRTSIREPVHSLVFGDDLAMVFLGGEVVVDYVLRLRREFDRERLWVTAYADSVPGYVPSERVLAEGGYEGGEAMRYYDQPGPFAKGLEDAIIGAVRAQLPAGFRPYGGGDPARTENIPPRDPGRAQASIRLPDGLRVQCVAAEPLIESPVWIDFGSDGRLWVCEYRDYPDPGAGVPKGRIKCLFDRDGDGVFDEAKVFLDDLVQPTGVTVWRDGVLVCSAPDVLFAADHDGDGVADERRVLLHGFATHNAQARVNSLTFGLDGFLYGAGGLFGGQIEVPANGSKQNLDSRDFRFDPDHGVLQSATGRAQYGRPRDDWGAWFGCHSTGFLQHYPLGDHYLARNADVPPPPFEVDASGPDGGRVLPISAQPERFNDLELLGRTTAACGATIYRDQWLGAQYAGNAFCCDPVSNVVHRIELTADGVTFAGRRPAGDSDREFLASTDFWFRPVQAVTGPDGALWVVDIARFVVEHPVFIAPQRLQQLDVRAGEHLGRIWRVLPAGAASKPLPDLLHLDNPGLVRLLAAANGALRDRAHELLLWRAAVDVAPQLEALARGGERATARLHALCVLDGLRALAPGLLLQALSDPEPGVRAHAVRLCESRLAGAPELLPAVLQLCADADAKVRLQVACSLGESRDQRVGAALAGMLRRDGGDPWLRAAALSSARPHAFALATSLYSATELPLADRFELLALLLSMLPPVVARVAGEDLAAAFTAARASLAGDGEPAERLAAVQLLRRSRSGPDRAALVAAFAPAAPADLLSALAAVLATIDDAALPDRLLADWNSQGPEFHAAVLDLLCQRRSFCLRLLEVAASTPAVRQSIDASHRQLLQQHADATVRERAGAVLTAASAGRVTVLAQYGGLDSRRGDPTLGAQVFAATCTACHRLGGEGREVGPDLAALRDKSTEALLVAILDPNRAVLDRYVQYVVTTTEDRTLSGRIESESDNALVLVTVDGTRATLLRSEVKSQVSTGRSLMPEGLEAAIDRDRMADLIAFLQQPALARKQCAGNTPATIVPAADGSLALTAATAEIYGGALVFEAALQNLGCWHGSDDHAVWTLDLPAARTFAVELEWACADAAAGNEFVVSAGNARLTGKVAATGPGWDRYQRQAVGELQLPAGKVRLELRPAGPLRSALLDLRALHLLPK